MKSRFRNTVQSVRESINEIALSSRCRFQQMINDADNENLKNFNSWKERYGEINRH